MRTLEEPFWLIDNIDVKRWYYRDAPAVGSTIRYVNEDFIDTVARVSSVAIWFESGHMMRRPYLFGRMVGWITAYLNRPRPRYARTTPTFSTNGSIITPQRQPNVIPVAV